MKKKLRISFNAPIVLSFSLICFVVTLLGIITKGRSTEAFFMTYRASLKNIITYMRFFTHIFGHANWYHFMGNASMILLLGPMLEEKHGSTKMAEIIAITALVTGLVNYMLFPNVALCGASGVVFAFILLTSFTDFKEGEIPITFILVAIIYLGQQVNDAMTIRDNTSNMAHIVGGAVGAIWGYTLNKKSKYRNI